MILAKRFPTLNVFSLFSSRTSVTISWPIKRGHDFLKWGSCSGTLLEEIKEEMQLYEKGNLYRSEHNFKIQQTKSNVAKLMGVDPVHFTDDEFKLSLLYLLPSDIEKKYYKPSIPKELPVKSILDIIAQYNSRNTLNDVAIENRDHRESIRLVHNVILHASQQVDQTPGLEMYIDRNEVISLPKTVSEGETESAIEADDLNHSFQLFPFMPRPSGNKDVNTALNLQFLKLNDLIKDRPDLIKMYYSVIKSIILDHDIGPESQSEHNGDFKSSLNPVFRAKVSQVFLFNSVETVMIPGSGMIAINGESYLDFFPAILTRMIVISPLRLSQTLGVFDIEVKIDQDDPSHVNSLAHCIAMSISSCLQQFDPSLKRVLGSVHKTPFRVEYKKAGKKNTRARRKWRKR